MLLEIQRPYTDIIDKLIRFGIANNPEEVVRQSLLAFSQQLNFEEEYLVNKAVEAETAEILNSKTQLTAADDVFALVGL